jgi:membrane protein
MRVESLLGGLIEERAGFSAIGALALLWISTRLVGGTRTVLREVFEVGRDRGILMGKLFDLGVVLVGGVLLLLNVGATVAVGALSTLDPDFLGFGGGFFRLLPILAGQLLSFASAWFLFHLLYRHLPLRRIPFRAAALGATFTAVAYEGLKGGFAWYVTSLASYSNAYGSLAVVAVLFFWIYYSAVVFILGGQVARTYEIRAEDRMRKNERVGEKGAAAAAGGALLALLVALSPAEGGAQAIAPFGGNGKVPGYLNQVDGVVFASSTLDRNLSLDRPLVEHSGPYIVVHLAENRVLLLDGTEVVWSAPAGTGHGFQLEGQGQ